MRGGYSTSVKLTREQRAMICAELAARRDAVFRVASKQDFFIRRIEGALSYLETTKNDRQDVAASRDRIKAFSKSLNDLQRAFTNLNETDVHLIQQLGSVSLPDFMFSCNSFLDQADGTLAAMRIPRGEHDHRPGGVVRFLVAQMAEAWTSVFDRSPSPKRDSAFSKVANVVLGQVEMEEIGEAALRTLLNR